MPIIACDKEKRLHRLLATVQYQGYCTTSSPMGSSFLSEPCGNYRSPGKYRGSHRGVNVQDMLLSTMLLEKLNNLFRGEKVRPHPHLCFSATSEAGRPVPSRKSSELV